VNIFKPLVAKEGDMLPVVAVGTFIGSIHFLTIKKWIFGGGFEQ
jgi:hypothetical protein